MASLDHYYHSNSVNHDRFYGPWDNFYLYHLQRWHDSYLHNHRPSDDGNKHGPGNDIHLYHL